MRSLIACGLALSLGLAACVPNDPLVPATGGDPTIPRRIAGGGTITEWSVDGQVFQRVHRRYVELEPEQVPQQGENDSDTLLLLPVRVEELVPELAAVVDPALPIEPEALHAFMADEWDHHINGKDDPGVDAKAFVALLTELDMMPATFWAIRQQAGLVIGDLVGDLRTARELGLQYGRQSPGDAADEVLARVKGDVRFPPLPPLKPLDDWLSRIGQSRHEAPLATQNEAAADGRSSTFFDVGRLSWQLIKDDETVADPRTAAGRTHVLHAGDGDPASYAGGRSVRKTYRMRERDAVIRSLVYTDFEVKFHCKYDARHATLPGHYLPEIYPEVTVIKNTFPKQLNATARVLQVVNAGDAVPNPVLKLKVDIQNGWLLDSRSYAYTETLIGNKGLL